MPPAEGERASSATESRRPSQVAPRNQLRSQASRGPYLVASGERELRSREPIAGGQGPSQGPYLFDDGLLNQDLIDEAVLFAFDGAHEVVALGVRLDPLHRLAGVLDQQLVQLVAGP